MSLNESIIKIRVELQNSKIKKSGLNNFAGFSYYELSDFLPTLNELMLKESVNDICTIQSDSAKLTLLKDKESQTYEIPFERFETPKNKSGQPSMQDIQYLGALNTYYKRYLYLNAFGITDGEVIDRMNNNNLNTQPSKVSAKKPVPKSTEWHDKLVQGLNAHGVDIAEFAKETGLSASSTEEQFKKVYIDIVANWEVDKQITFGKQQ